MAPPAHPGLCDGDERVGVTLTSAEAPRELQGPNVAFELEPVPLDEGLDVVRSEPDRLAAALDGPYEVSTRFGEDVVEDHRATRRERCGESDHALHRLGGDVHRDADPEHDRRRTRVETGAGEPSKRVVVLEVRFDVDHAPGETLRQPALSAGERGKVDLEGLDVEAVSAAVEARTQEHQLRGALPQLAGDGFVQMAGA